MITKWSVGVTQSGNVIHVRPVRGLCAQANWALTSNPRRSTSFWRAVTGRYLRDEYPRGAKQLIKAMAFCQEWCDRRNAYEAEVAELVARANIDDTDGAA